MLLTKENHWLSRCISILTMTETIVNSSIRGSVETSLMLNQDKMLMES